MAILRTIEGLRPGQVFPLEGESAVLGRNPDCDIVLDVGAISRQHARIVNLGGRFHIEDLGSRNGTFLNERPVSTRELLTDGDLVRICDLAFVFHDRPTVEESEVALTESGPAMLVDDEQTTSSSTIMTKLDVSAGPAGLRLTVRPEAKLKALIEIGRNLGGVLRPDEVMPKLLDSLFAVFPQADRGFIVLKSPDSGRLIPMAVKHRRERDGETIRISRTIVGEVMDAREAILSADAATDSRFDMAESIVDFQIRSMMCAPLIGIGGNALGVIQIDTIDQRQRFDQEDLDVLASVAGQVARVVENAQLHESALKERALEQELATAHEVQQGFLPSERPRLDGYGFFDFYEPASQLGGDYYDYISLPDGSLAIVLADVSGKGISASLLVAKLSAEIRYCLVSEPTAAAAIGRLNNIFCQPRWQDRFVTIVIAVLDPAGHNVTLVNAGHMAPLLCGRSREVEAVGQSQSGLPLGVDRDTVYDKVTVSLGPGDSLTLYSDGITEAMNDRGDLYGRDRLVNQVGSDSTADDSTDDMDLLGRRILDDVKRFVGSRPQSDDMCLTCFGRTPGA